MTITQTIEVPADHRVFFEFLAPREIPAGKARVEVKVTPVIEKQDKPAEGRTKPYPAALAELLSQPTPHADALLGILSGLGDITLEQIRDERLAKHLK
jgi:hypothetical protein